MTNINTNIATVASTNLSDNPAGMYKAQKFFVKDGDDNYISRRPQRRMPSNKPKQIYTKCECSGKIKLYGATDANGRTSTKCNKCGKRVYIQHYKGKAGLVRCY